MSQDASPPASPYRLFDVTLKAKAPLSPHLWRFTFAGPEVDRMAASPRLRELRRSRSASHSVSG